MVDEAKLLAHFVQLLKCWLCDVWSGIVTKKNWALRVDQCQLQGLQLSVHLINLLSILLRCNGFTGIQKAVVDQTGSRPPDWPWPFILVQVWLWEVLWSFFSVQPLSWLSPGVVWNPLFVAHHNHNQQMVCCCCVEYEKMTPQNDIFGLQLAHEAPTYWAFSAFQFASNAEWP